MEVILKIVESEYQRCKQMLTVGGYTIDESMYPGTNENLR